VGEDQAAHTLFLRLAGDFCDAISRFEQDYMGRGPKAIHTYLLGDLLVVRLQGVLTAAEQHLGKSLPAEKGRETAWPAG